MTPKERAANYMKLKKGYKMKQTAVEWLAEKYNYITWLRNRDEISALKADKWRVEYLLQAKEMEKQQIIDAWVADNNELQRIAAEQYYNEIFKNE